MSGRMRKWLRKEPIAACRHNFGCKSSSSVRVYCLQSCHVGISLIALKYIMAIDPHREEGDAAPQIPVILSEIFVDRLYSAADVAVDRIPFLLNPGGCQYGLSPPWLVFTHLILEMSRFCCLLVQGV